MHKKSFVLAFVLAGVACGGDDTTGGGAGSTGQAAGDMTQGSGGSGGTSNGSGAGGTSAGGSAMAGGASGASVGSGGANTGTDAGSMCTVRDQNACDTCVFAKCCDSYAACTKDEDCVFGIGALAECVANDATMVAQCYDDFAITNAAAEALRTCVKTSCDAPCTTVTP